MSHYNTLQRHITSFRSYYVDIIARSYPIHHRCLAVMKYYEMSVILCLNLDAERENSLILHLFRNSVCILNMQGLFYSHRFDVCRRLMHIITQLFPHFCWFTTSRSRNTLLRSDKLFVCISLITHNNNRLLEHPSKDNHFHSILTVYKSFGADNITREVQRKYRRSCGYCYPPSCQDI